MAITEAGIVKNVQVSVHLWRKVGVVEWTRARVVGRFCYFRRRKRKEKRETNWKTKTRRIRKKRRRWME